VPEIEAWGIVEGGDTTKATLKLGLFGYDITCIAKYCAAQDDYYPYCHLIDAKGIDGLAFGIHWDLDVASTKSYYVGFHQTEGRDTMAGFKKAQNGIVNKVWLQNYTVTEDVFTSTWGFQTFNGDSNYYGLG